MRLAFTGSSSSFRPSHLSPHSSLFPLVYVFPSSHFSDAERKTSHVASVGPQPMPHERKNHQPNKRSDFFTLPSVLLDLSLTFHFGMFLFWLLVLDIGCLKVALSNLHYHLSSIYFCVRPGPRAHLPNALSLSLCSTHSSTHTHTHLAAIA